MSGPPTAADGPGGPATDPKPGLPLGPGLRMVDRPVAEVVREVRRRGIEPQVIGPVASKQGLITALGAELGFPDWVGTNWDALHDILQNLLWRPDGPHVIVWSGPERLRDADPDAYAMALRVLRESVEASLPTPRPLTFLLTPEE